MFYTTMGHDNEEPMINVTNQATVTKWPITMVLDGLTVHLTEEQANDLSNQLDLALIDLGVTK